MKKFEIIQNRRQIDRKKRAEIRAGCTTRQDDQWPDVMKSFDNLEDALESLKGYTSSIFEQTASTGRYYTVTEYYVQENEYDEKGEWVGGDIWEFSPFQIRLVEMPGYDTIGIFDNYEDAEQAAIDYGLANENNDENWVDIF